MEFKINVFQNEEGIFAEVLSESGNQICIADGDSPYLATKEVCSAFSDILDIMEEDENKEISNIIKQRVSNDDGVRYSLDDVKNMKFD